MTTIAIAGATGAVGQQMLECLKERNIKANLKLLASARSKGKEIDGHIVEELTKESFHGDCHRTRRRFRHRWHL